MTKQFLILFCFLIYCQTSIHAQDLTEIIKNHKTNLKDLYATRGAPEAWVTTGNVDEYSLISVINSYEKNVGIVIYSHKNDTLTLSLISKKGLVNTQKTKTTKEEITEKVYDVNTLFASQFSENIPSMRGSKGNDTKKKKEKLEASYKELNKLLFPPTFKLEEFNHIIFVPIYNLSTLPFAAFKLGEAYLIDKMSFSIAPSLFELMVSKNINDNQNGYYKSVSYNWENALFVANPKYPNDATWNFPNLPGTLKEVEQITKSLPTETYKLLTGNSATKLAVKENICEYDLLYFATHGISNSENPLDHSFLVLAEGNNDSAFFTMKEIMNLRYTCQLKADLVVLSACQTGLGKSHEGGIIGLARAFQIAGANHILMSLWSINDEETSKLMVLFFNELKLANSLQPHESLRNAILKYKKEVNSDPKYWAAFSIFGVPY